MFPLRKANSKSVIDKLWTVFCRWGVPRTIVSDNGTQFTSKEYQSWCSMIGLKMFYISAYHPQANMTERYIQTLKKMIVTTSDKIKDWDLHVGELCFALRTAVNDSTGFSPMYILTGQEPRTPFDNLFDIEIPNNKHCKDISNRMASIHNIVLDEITKSQELYMKHYNQKSKFRTYKLGDLVLVKTHFLSDASKGFSVKLASKRDGPYRVIRVVSASVFDVEHVESGQKIYECHVNEMSSYHSRNVPSTQ